MKKILLGFLIVAALSACSSSKEKKMDIPTEIQAMNQAVEVNANTLTEVKYQLEEAQEDAIVMAEYVKMVKAYEGTGATVTTGDGTLNLTLPGDATFKSGQSMLNQEMKAVLDPLAETLKNYPEANVMIKGNTDSSGSEEANQKLSSDRALAVSKYLVDKGINSSRMGVVGVGSSEPIDDNATKIGRMANRRVDLTIAY